MRSTPLLLVACLAALMAGAQAIAVCDSGWDYLYTVSKNGQSYNDKNANVMYDRIMPALIAGEECKLLRSIKGSGCYDSIRAVDGRQLKGEYGFVARVQVACPGEQPKWQNAAVTATAWRNGSFKITWTYFQPIPPQQAA
ncbi:hypothetical protein ABPG75_003331 [Micractinium tetrahymenae]